MDNQTGTNLFLEITNHAKVKHGGEVYTSFPNADFLPGEFVPGNYVYRISYLESNGKAVEKSIEFSITEPITSGLSIEEVRENLRKVSKDTLSKVNDLFGEPEGDEPRIFNQRELTWLVEYDQMTEKEEYSLTNQQLIKLAEKWNLKFCEAGEPTDNKLSKCVSCEDTGDIIIEDLNILTLCRGLVVYGNFHLIAVNNHIIYNIATKGMRKLSCWLIIAVLTIHMSVYSMDYTNDEVDFDFDETDEVSQTSGRDSHQMQGNEK